MLSPQKLGTIIFLKNYLYKMLLIKVIPLINKTKDQLWPMSADKDIGLGGINISLRFLGFEGIFQVL